jgi:aclacinomycin oxidase
MADVTRRGLLRIGAMAGGTAITGAVGATPAYAESAWSDCPQTDLGPVSVGPQDARYQDLTSRAYNGRFIGRPESVRVVGSPNHVAAVVAEAVRDGKRIAVRSGGHCFENFVDNPDVRIVLDVSEMKQVYFDKTRSAFAVESGATLGQVYRTLYLGWGVTIPGGGCPSVGVGGHVAGGGYGPLSQRHGLVIDHLFAVEVVVVDAAGKVRTVVATRDPADPNHDLWWAHTGGGGGNFGVVTRYWFRTPGTTGTPSALLPKPPATLINATVLWQWNDLTEQAFTTLTGAYGSWQQQHAATTNLNTGLFLYHRAIGQVELDVQADGTDPGAAQSIAECITAVTKDVGAPHTVSRTTTPWLRATLAFNDGGTGTLRFKSKSAYLRRPWTDAQIATVHRYLTDNGDYRYGAFVHLGSFGGKVNTVSASATAASHRDSVLNAYFETSWQDPQQDRDQLAWVRTCYRDVHSATGGVPVPGADCDGAFINYADSDLADPTWNTSGVPWHALYYKDNYPRLQAVKARWDRRDMFRHALSVRLPG